MVSISLIIALIFGFPFRWIHYKGEQMVSIFEVYNLGIKYTSFDITLLFINTFIIYKICHMILQPKIKKYENS